MNNHNSQEDLDEDEEKAVQLPRRGNGSSRGSEILNVHGAAAMLDLPVSTVYRLVRQGKLPAARLGKQLRFTRKSLIQAVEAGESESGIAANTWKHVRAA